MTSTTEQEIIQKTGKPGQAVTTASTLHTTKDGTSHYLPRKAIESTKLDILYTQLQRSLIDKNTIIVPVKEVPKGKIYPIFLGVSGTAAGAAILAGNHHIAYYAVTGGVLEPSPIDPYQYGFGLVFIVIMTSITVGLALANSSIKHAIDHTNDMMLEIVNPTTNMNVGNNINAHDQGFTRS